MDKLDQLLDHYGHALQEHWRGRAGTIHIDVAARAIREFVGAAAMRPQSTRPEEREPKKVVAWLHRHHTTAYVITDTIKQLWLKAKPEHVENYTVPLYFGESLAAPVSPLATPKVCGPHGCALPCEYCGGKP